LFVSSKIYYTTVYCKYIACRFRQGFCLSCYHLSAVTVVFSEHKNTPTQRSHASESGLHSFCFSPPNGHKVALGRHPREGMRSHAGRQRSTNTREPTALLDAIEISSERTCGHLPLGGPRR
jgi:hypothetical protein